MCLNFAINLPKGQPYPLYEPSLHLRTLDWEAWWRCLIGDIYNNFCLAQFYFHSRIWCFGNSLNWVNFINSILDRRLTYWDYRYFGEIHHEHDMHCTQDFQRFLDEGFKNDFVMFSRWLWFKMRWKTSEDIICILWWVWWWWWTVDSRGSGSGEVGACNRRSHFSLLRRQTGTDDGMLGTWYQWFDLRNYNDWLHHIHSHPLEFLWQIIHDIWWNLK